jgi:hypothetical protein
LNMCLITSLLAVPDEVGSNVCVLFDLSTGH